MIPIVYIHYGNLPSYLYTSINQALKQNSNIILLSENQNSIPKIKNYAINEYNEGVSDLESKYVHMSTNNYDIELICIKRWFVLRNLMNKLNIDVCYYSDSDVMIYDNLSNIYEQYKEFDASFVIVDEQENFRWSASGCCSFWKKETLNKFCDFISEIYLPENSDVLHQKWDYHQQNKLDGGICDMTLLYLFSKQINYFALTKVQNNCTFDQYLFDSENFLKNEYLLDDVKINDRSIKKISWKNNKPFGYNQILKQEVRFIAIAEHAKVIEQKNLNKISPFRKFKNIIKRVLKKIEHKPIEKKYGWFGNYKSWEKAKSRCTGYDNKEILEKVKNAILKVKNGEAKYERDSVLFDEIQYSQPLLDTFIKIAKENNNELSIVDFGGSLGSSYFQNKPFLENIALKNWSIVEQPHFVDCGKEHIEDNILKFYYTIEEALKHHKAQVLLLSSVLAYFEHPYKLIEECKKYGFEYIIIDRTAFLEAVKERITVQIVPEFIYKASYPSWFFNEQKFVNAFLDTYQIIGEFDSKFDPREQLEDSVWSYRKGFVFKKK